MSKLAQPRPRAVRRPRLDRLRRPQVALVLDLRCSSSLVAVFGLVGPQAQLGIEFEGGVEYRVVDGRRRGRPGRRRRRSATPSQDSGIENASAPIVNTSGEDNIRVQTEPLTNDEVDRGRAR